MKPIVLKENPEGKIDITADEIQKMVNDAYNEGYKDGANYKDTIIAPIYPYPYYPTYQYQCEITC